MKKLFLAVTLIVCVFGGGAHAQLIYSTDFSAAEGFIDGPVAGQPAGAASVWIDGNPDTVPAENIVIANETLTTTVTGADSKWVYIMIPVQKGTITVTWDWQYVGPSDGFVDTGFCLSDSANFEQVDGNPAPNFNEQGAMVRMTNDTTNGTGVIDVRNGDWAGGGAYEVLNTVLYQDGKKISMRSEINIVDFTFSVYAQREGEAEVQIAEDFGFRRITTAETDGLNCLSMWEDLAVEASIGNQCIIDNIVIAGPTSISEWALY